MKLNRTSLRASLGMALATLLTSVLPASALATLDLKTNTSQLLVNETELQVEYGKYSEATIALPGAGNRRIEWNILGSNVPPGFSIYDTNTSNLVLYGTPTFTGTWCTVYVAQAKAAGATSADASVQGMQEVCFSSRESQTLRAPRFATEKRYLDAVEPNASFSTLLAVDARDNGRLQGEVYESAIPENSAKLAFKNGQFTVSGRVAAAGAYGFALKAKNASGLETYRQYVLLIQAANETPTCPAGYYFDNQLGYCVPADTDTQLCPSGSYYDPNSRACLGYPMPPSEIQCSIGYYFDPFLTTCVIAEAERCPLNYSYDIYEGRCVRQPYTCGFGERYDYVYQDCVRVYRQSCSFGQHYDYARDRCVRDYQSCYSGFYYSEIYDRCMPVNYRCGIDEVYDPRYGGCRSTRPSMACPSGTRFDYSSNRCVSVYVNRPQHCSPGHRYDPVYGRCVAYQTRPQQPRPQPQPMPRPQQPRPTQNPGPMPRPVPQTPSCPPGTTYNSRVGRCSSPTTPGPQQPRPQQPPRPAPQPDPRPRQESPRQESPRQESPRQESPRQESPRQESPRQESPRQESPRQESPRQESPRQESPRQESPRQESPRQESPRQESPRQESPRQESPRQESPRQESPRQESPRQESPRQESPRQESPRQESPRPQPQPVPQPRPEPRQEPRPTPAPAPRQEQPRSEPRSEPRTTPRQESPRPTTPPSAPRPPAPRPRG